MGPTWETLQKEIDLADPTPFIDQVYLGCTQREAKVDPHVVQSKNELFTQLTRTRETREADDKFQTKEHICWERSLLGAVIWKVMPKNALMDTMI